MVLHDLGYTPVHHTLQAALEEVDSDKSGEIDFEEFKILMSKWRAMEGLTKEEYAEMKELFYRFDSDNDGELSTDDQLRLKRYLGFSDEQPRNDRGRKFPVAWKRFLADIRRSREAEVKKFRAMFEKEDTDGSGELDASEILKVIEHCGFEPLKKRLAECIEQVDEDGTGTLNFDEFVQIMWLYRRTEGFTEEEQEELEGIFKKFDEDDSGEVSTLELGDLLRHEGYQPNLDQLHKLGDKFDVDGTGDIGLREFYKIMRCFREEEIQSYRQLFVKYDRNSNGQISTDELGGVLQELGRKVSLSIVEEAIKSVDEDLSGDLDWDEFVELMEQYRKFQVRERRRKCGFTDEQVEEFREQFKSYDKDNSDDLDNLELVRLLSDLKMAPRTAFEQMHMMQMLEHCREQAEETEGKNTFWVFLRLLRTLEDDQDRGSLAVERKAAEKAGFSQDEVREFREIFTHWHDKLAELGDNCGALIKVNALTTEGIARMLRSLGVHLPTPADHEALDVICRECYTEDHLYIDFPAFLCVMRRLMDSNFKGILQHIAQSA